MHSLVMKMSAGQQAALDRLLEETAGPFVPNHYRRLTPEQFGDRFGLSRSDYAAVVSFQTEIHNYVADGEHYHSNATAVSQNAGTL